MFAIATASMYHDKAALEIGLCALRTSSGKKTWTLRKGSTMPDSDRPIDPLPDDFGSEEAAAAFWDSHSIADYEEFLEPVDFQVNVNRRHFEIEVYEECFVAVRETARKQHKPVKQLASEIIKQRLASI